MLQIKRNDTGIGIEATLTNKDGNVDLTGADVSFLFRGQDITPQMKNAEEGNVIVIFNEAQTNKTGFYNAEFKVRFADGRLESFPNCGHIKVRICESLDAE